MHTRLRWSEHKPGRKKKSKVLLFDPSIAHNTMLSHFPDFTCPYKLRNLKINETVMRNQHVQVNRNLSHHSKHFHSRVRYPLLSIAQFFTAIFFFRPGNSFTWGSYHKMVIGLTSKMLLSIYTQNITVLFIFIVKGAMQLLRHSPEENQE